MTKKPYDETARLLEENRELKKLNRTLLKRLKKFDRNAEDSLVEESEEEILRSPFPVRSRVCPECIEGTLLMVKIANRTWEKCNKCEYRTKAKKT